MESSTSSLVRQIVPYIPALLIAYLIVTRTLTWYRLRHFPGPFLGRFSSLFMVKAVITGRMHLEYENVAKRYGSLARIGPNDLITDDPEVIKKMNAARSTYKRSMWYEATRIDPYRDFLISIIDTNQHDTQRAKMSSAFNTKENPFMESDVDWCVSLWVDLIRRKYVSKGEKIRPMDLARKSQYFTLDVITKIGFGDEFGYLSGDEDVHSYIGSLDGVMLAMAVFGTMPLTNRIIGTGWVRAMLGPGPKDEFGMGKLMSLAEKVVAQRFGDNKIERQDMIGAFVRSGIPQYLVETEILMQIVAGSDSSATAIRATLLYLLSNPRVLNKLRTEIDEAVRLGKISSPITEVEAKTLPYLQAVIKEGLRIWPPLPSLFPKEVPETGDVINGQYVPPGTNIAINQWAIQRNAIYGKDVEAFRPERWIEADGERLLRMEQCLDLIFGTGRFGCLGKTVASMELNKVFVELLRHFNFELMYPDRNWTSTNYNFFQQKEMWVRVSEREKGD